VVCVEKVSGSGRYDRVVRMIEESEKQFVDIINAANQE